MASKLAKSIAMRALVVNAQGGLDGPYDTSLLNVATETDNALASVRECLEQVDRALRSLPRDALERDPQQGYYYRDELMKRVMLITESLKTEIA